MRSILIDCLQHVWITHRDSMELVWNNIYIYIYINMTMAGIGGAYRHRMCAYICISLYRGLLVLLLGPGLSGAARRKSAGALSNFWWFYFQSRARADLYSWAVNQGKRQWFLKIITPCLGRALQWRSRLGNKKLYCCLHVALLSDNVIFCMLDGFGTAFRSKRTRLLPCDYSNQL